MTTIIAIDGPSSGGKSTLARRLAEALGAGHLNTGLLYRAFGLKALQEDLDPTDEETAVRILDKTTIEIVDQMVLLDGQEAKGLESEEVAEAASRFAIMKRVRDWMVTLQRLIAQGSAGLLVVEGRDIGSVVFPDAKVKFFVTASAEERSLRRARDLDSDSKVIIDVLNARDERDASREHSPLVPAQGACLIDTTDRSVEDVLKEMRSIVREVGL